MIINKNIFILFSVVLYFVSCRYINNYFYTMLFPTILTIYVYLYFNNLVLKKRNNSHLYYLLFPFLILIFVNIGLVRLDLHRIATIGVFFMPAIGIYLLSTRYPINEKNMLTLLYILIIPDAIIYSFIYNSYHFGTSSGRFLVFLIDEIYTASILSLYFVIILSLFNKTKNKYLLFSLFFILFLTYYTGSRGSLLTIILIIIFNYIYFNKFFNKFFKIILPIVVLIALYFTPLVLHNTIKYIPNTVATQLKLNNNNDFSGRAWLWAYHYSLFIKHPIVGNSNDKIALKLHGTTPDGERVRASSESFFTALLARDGIFAVCWYFVYFFFVYLSIKKKNNFAYLLSLLFLFMNYSLSTYSQMYNMFTVIGFWLYFSSYSKKKLYKDTFNEN